MRVVRRGGQPLLQAAPCRERSAFEDIEEQPVGQTEESKEEGGPPAPAEGWVPVQVDGVTYLVPAGEGRQQQQPGSSFYFINETSK